MVMSDESIYDEYCTIATWWDESETMGRVIDNKAVLNEDFSIEKKAENYIISSAGHPLFRYDLNLNKNIKAKVVFTVIAEFDITQFETIHSAFTNQIICKYMDIREEVLIKEMVDAPNIAAAVNSLVKKYSH